MSTPNPTPLRVGIFYENVQLSDIVGIDLLGNMTPEIISTVTSMMPHLSHFNSLAVPISFHYISSSLSPAQATPDIRIVPTHTYATAPRDLDVLILGGPDPSAVNEESLKFLKEAKEKTRWILSTCTGGMWLARAGVLEGKRATTNRMMLGLAGQICPGTRWEDKRWVVEEGWFEGAQIWTAGGAGCGVDMMIEFVMEKFDNRLVKMGCQGLDWEIEGRSQVYKSPLPTLSENASDV